MLDVLCFVFRINVFNNFREKCFIFLLVIGYRRDLKKKEIRDELMKILFICVMWGMLVILVIVVWLKYI